MELLDNTESEKSSKNTVLMLLDGYKKLGEDFHVYNYDVRYGIVGNLTLKDLPDAFFIDYINTYVDKITIDKGVGYNFIKFYYEIYQDVLIKRRLNKITRIKNKMNGYI